MQTLHLTTDLIDRVDRWSGRFHAARMGALMELPENPYGVEIRNLRMGTACKVRHPLLRGKNRIIGFTPDDLLELEDLMGFYANDDLPFTLGVSHGRMTPELFQRLVQAGLWSAGSGTVPALDPSSLPVLDGPVPNATGIRVRQSGPEERELYLDLFQQAFSYRDERDPDYRAIQWAEDSLPGSPRYIAEIDGVPIGIASFPIVDRIGYMGTAGVIAAYRGRGAQAALIARRIADAPTFGCDLILAGGSPGSTTYRNFERAGFRLVLTGSGWRQTTP